MYSNKDQRDRGGRYLLTLVGTPPRVYALTKSATTIGRSVDCDIRIDEVNVSRIHAEIQLAEEGCRIIDHSSNGTLVNNQKITTYLPQPGDEIVIGSTTLTLSVKERRSWILPQRATLRCVQLTLVLALFCAIAFGYPLDNVATYWGNAWDDMIANARAGMIQPSPAVTEVRSPKFEIRKDPVSEKQSPEIVARETPPGQDRPDLTSDLEIRSRGAVETLRKNIMDDLAANDLELAEVHLESFKKGEFYYFHLDAAQVMDALIRKEGGRHSYNREEPLAVSSLQIGENTGGSGSQLHTFTDGGIGFCKVQPYHMIRDTQGQNIYSPQGNITAGAMILGGFYTSASNTSGITGTNARVWYALFAYNQGGFPIDTTPQELRDGGRNGAIYADTIFGFMGVPLPVDNTR